MKKLLWCCLFLFCSHTTIAQQITRVASINICADLLLYQLAPEKITSISFLAFDHDYSTIVDELNNRNIASNRAQATDLLLQQPDLVLASVYTPSQKVNFLQSLGLNVWQIGAPQTLDDVYEEILSLAKVLKVEARGDALVAKMQARQQLLDTELETLNVSPPLLLSLSANKHISGPGSFTHQIIELGGFTNLGASVTNGYWSKQSLESLLLLRPDVWMMASRHDDSVENTNPNARYYDKANEYLRHRAFKQTMHKSEILYMPSNLASCFGPQTLDAVEILVHFLAHRGSR